MSFPGSEVGLCPLSSEGTGLSVCSVLLGFAKYIHILKSALLEDPANETLFTKVHTHNAVPSVRSVYGVSLRPLAG